MDKWCGVEREMGPLVMDTCVGGVGTPPPNDTWHAFLSGLAPSGFPQEDTWRAFSVRTPSGRGTRHSPTSHPDDSHITSG